MCDARLQFHLLLQGTQMMQLLTRQLVFMKQLPSGLFIAGDAAYMLTEHLLFPSQDLAGKTLTINHFKFLPDSS
jgi:hypothetical protein